MAESPIRIEFVVPGQPVGKARARTGRGFAYTPAKTVDYQNWVRLCAVQKLNGNAPIDGPVRVHLEVEVQIPLSWGRKRRRAAAAGDILPAVKPDADNIEKAIWDACSSLVWVDDKQVVDWSGRKRYSGMPQVRVIVESLTSTEDENDESMRATVC